MSVGSGDDFHAGIEAGDGLKQFRGGVGPHGNEHGGKPGVQRGAGQAGDGLGRQGLLVPVRQHNPFAAAVPLPTQGLQPGGQLRGQRDRPVRVGLAGVLR